MAAHAQGTQPLLALAQQGHQQVLDVLASVVAPQQQATDVVGELVAPVGAGQHAAGGLAVERAGVFRRGGHGAELAGHRHGPRQVVIETVDGANQQALRIVQQAPFGNLVGHGPGLGQGGLFVRPRGRVARLEELQDALAHLRGRLAGEGDRQDFLRRLDHGQQPEVAFDQQGGLARTGRGLDDDRTLRFDGQLPLPGITHRRPPEGSRAR